MGKRHDQTIRQQGGPRGATGDVLAENPADPRGSGEGSEYSSDSGIATERVPGSDAGHLGAKKKSPYGDFFAVEARLWPVVCSLGLNAAVAYLVLARGTDKPNIHTSWSVHAIETYTCISRVRAAAAIERLIANSLMVRTDANRNRPRYRLLTFVEFLRLQGQHGRWNSVSASEHKAAATSDWIWLPNSLVTGAAKEKPPVELMRQTQDVMALRLLVELYHEQHLRADGGLSRRLLLEEHKRHRLGEQGPFVLWGFEPEGVPAASLAGPLLCHRRDGVDDPAVDLWRRIELLEGLGLLEFVPHLVEGPSPDAEILHPYGMGQTDSLEDRLGAAASDAAYALLTDTSTNWANRYCVAPVLAHIQSVQLVGIARLRYRPRTRMTAAWWGHLHEAAEQHLTVYDEIVEAKRVPAAMCNIKGSIKG